VYQERPFLLHWNSSYDTQRALVFELQETHRDGFFSHTRTIGQLCIPMSDLSRHCTHSGVYTTAQYHFSTNDEEHMTGGTLQLSIRRLPADSQYKTDKHKHECKRMHDIITWIHQFNQQLKDEKYALQLTGNIPVQGRSTLLHSAVYLSEPKLIHAILQLGADPLWESSAGTALALAKKLAQKNEEHMRQHHNKSTKGHQRRLLLECIVQRLQSAVAGSGQVSSHAGNDSTVASHAQCDLDSFEDV
jgi:hypothetical protein